MVYLGVYNMSCNINETWLNAAIIDFVSALPNQIKLVE